MTERRPLGPAAAAVYVVLALAVAGPALAGGLVLAVDLSLTPHPRLDEGYWGVGGSIHGVVNQLPLDALFVGLGKLGAVAIGEKILLVAIVALAGTGMHAAAARAAPVGAYYAGFLYAVNPFVYDRLYTGEWYLLLGYALLPWAWRAFTATVDGDASPLRFAVLATAVGCTSVPMVGLLAVLCVATVAVAPPRPRRGLAALALATLGCGYWLLPTPGLHQAIAAAGPRSLVLYATVPDARFGLAAAVAGLYGYWNDAVPIKAHLPGWPALALALVVLALYGLVVRRRDPRAWAVAAAGALGFLVALGADGPTGGAFAFALRHVGVLRAYREPQKAVALLVLAYAYLGAAAVADLVRWPRRRAAAVAALLCALPLAYGYRTFGGLWGALRPTAFPGSWAEAASVLARDPRRARTLFLPWHGYFALDFAGGRVVANPGAQYFPAPVLSSRAVGEASAPPPDTLDGGIARLLDDAAGGRVELGKCLALLGVSHVVVARQADYARYAFLGRRRDLAVELRTPGIVVYRNLVPTALVDAILRGRGACTTVPVPSTRPRPSEYRLAAPPAHPQRLALAVPFDAGWSGGAGKPSRGPFGSTLVPAGARTRTLSYTGEAGYLRNYAVGAAAALAALTAAVASRRGRRGRARTGSPA